VIPELKTGVTTNEYGFYPLPKGNYTVQISYLGYLDYFRINISKPKYKKQFNLFSNETALQEVSLLIIKQN
jgi:hypothetical protein